MKIVARRWYRRRSKSKLILLRRVRFRTFPLRLAMGGWLHVALHLWLRCNSSHDVVASAAFLGKARS